MIGTLIAGTVILYNVRAILPPFILAAVVAYILNPLVDALEQRTRCSRTCIVVILYILLIIGLIVLIVLVTPTLVHQVRAINIDLESIGARIRQLLDDYQHVEIAGFPVDVLALVGEVRGAIQSIVSFVAARTGGLVFGVLSGLVWVVLILLVSFYLLKDVRQIKQQALRLLPEAYQSDIDDLVFQINGVLSSYLRGQIVLMLVVGMVTGVALAVVGVRNALLLGILAGLLEVIPTIGPVMAAIPAVVIALFQGSTHLALDNHWFALLVIGLYTFIQQVENNLLVPRIIGSSVNLHPVVVIFGVLAGASLAGVLGVLLAVPTISIGRILATYVYHKLMQ